jgi:ribosomal protein S20
VVDVGDDAEAADPVEVGQGILILGAGAGSVLLPLPVHSRRGFVANIKSQKKRNRRTSAARAQQGRPSELKTRVKWRPRAVRARRRRDDWCGSRAEAAHKAAARAIIHKNQAARRTSRS